uniref:Aamy domain-containing protein n=1 Tax=Loa loa TaxID=7209 RepID=A0A1I7VEA2_LOALO
MDDLRMPLSEDTKTPQVYKLEIRESNHDGVQPPFPSKSDGNEIKASETVRLIGLTKNELEKYCNDPFWKVVRYAMFVLFWVAWILMFLTAVLLIVFSPKCAVVKEPEWWRKQVSYQIFTPSFRDSNDDGIGDFNGIREKLHDLRKIGIRTIWVTPIITIQKAKTGDDYVDYYVWEKSIECKDDPNYIAEEGKENAYLAYDGKDPILNWRNPAVRERVDGFHIDRIGQLIKHLSKSEGHVALSMIDGFIGSLREYASSTEIPNSREIVVFTSLNDFAKLEGSDSSGLSNFTYVIDDSITVLNNGSCPNGIAQCLHSTLIRSFEWFNTRNFHTRGSSRIITFLVLVRDSIKQQQLY